MPAFASSNKRFSALRYGVPAADWSTFLAQVADPTVRYVRAPQGMFDVGAGLNIAQSNKIINFRGCLLTVTDPTYQPVIISSSTVAATEKQCTGTVDETTDRITVLDGIFAAGVAIGDNHIIRLGVQDFDPQEPQYSCIRRVVAKEGSVLIYDEPFGYDCPVYASEAALEAVTNYPERVGPWGLNTDTGWFQRGLGTDHGIRTIGTLAENILIEELSLRYDGNERMFGAWGILVGASRGVTLRQCHVNNPHGSALHLYFANDCLIDGMSVTGTGRGAPFGGTVKTNIAVAVSSWASYNCDINNVNLDCEDVDLFNFESGNRQMRSSDCRINSTFGAFPVSPSVGFYGPGDVSVTNLRINIAQYTNSRLFPAYLNETDLINMVIETAAAPDVLLWQGKGNYLGGFTWGSNEFSAPETVVTDFTAIPSNVPIPYPDGIIMECTFTILSRDGFQSFSIGGDPFVANPGALVFSKTADQNQIAAGVTYSQYRATLASHRVYRTGGSGNAPVSMSCKVMRLIA